MHSGVPQLLVAHVQVLERQGAGASMCMQLCASDPLKTGRGGATALQKQAPSIALCSTSVKMHIRGAAW